MYTKSFFIIIILLIQSNLIFSQSSRQFNFVYKYQKNVYDSKKMMFTKDMVLDSVISFKICLTKAERKLIFNKLKQIDFWKYPDKYKYENADSTDNSISQSQPCFNYSMKVRTAETDKIVNWSDCISGKGSKNNQYEKLRELHNLIYKIITEKKAFKNSPKPKSAYN